VCCVFGIVCSVVCIFIQSAADFTGGGTGHFCWRGIDGRGSECAGCWDCVCVCARCIMLSVLQSRDEPLWH
jgi:hypothetical protein